MIGCVSTPACFAVAALRWGIGCVFILSTLVVRADITAKAAGDAYILVRILESKKRFCLHCSSKVCFGRQGRTHSPKIWRSTLVAVRRRDQALMQLDMQKQQQGPPGRSFGNCCRRTCLYDEYDWADVI